MKGGESMDSIYSDFAYDDAFRTMVVKCDELLIPFINFMFDMNYSKKAHIYRNANERYLDQQGGSQDKRITDTTPDKMEIVMHTSGGDSRYFVEVMKESDFDLEKVFENELYFLLPFYSFNYKNEFENIEKDEDKQEQFINVYRNIIDMLEELVSEEMLSTFSKDVIISLINKISYKQLMRYQDTQKIDKLPPL